jgi:predicted RNA-binding Zn ribbon-like protein
MVVRLAICVPASPILMVSLSVPSDEPSLPSDRFVPFGGRLCLDFANTVNGRLTGSPDDLLATVDDLAAWGCRMGLLSEANARTLVEAASANPRAAGLAHARAIALREHLYGVFVAIATGAHPPAGQVRSLMDTYRATLANAELVAGAPGGPWRWQPIVADDPLQLDWLVWPVIHSTLDVLTSADLLRLRRCAGADRGCAGLFVDDTRNGIRRWCSMDGCGSRAKMRRMYARKRAAV